MKPQIENVERVVVGIINALGFTAGLIVIGLFLWIVSRP